MKSEVKTMGEVIRLVREQKGLSRKRLALMCQRQGSPVHPNTIYRMETGLVDYQLATIEAVCMVLDIKLEARPKRIAR